MTEMAHCERGSFYSPGEMSTQNLVLTVLELHLTGVDSVWSGALVEMFGDLGFSAKATRAAVARLVVAGMLERLRNGKFIDYAFTTRAGAVLDETRSRISAFGQRSGRADVWTMLFHTIPVDRAVLRSLGSSLRFRGFGSPQDATWVAAGDHESDLRALVDELDVERHTVIFVARHCPGSSKAMPSRTWDLDDLTRRYDDFLDRYAGLDLPKVGSALTDREAFILRIRQIWAFRSLVQLDPVLPESTPSLRGRRARAIALYEGAREVLRIPADRHFDKVASEGPSVCYVPHEIVAHAAQATHFDGTARLATAGTAPVD